MCGLCGLLGDSPAWHDPINSSTASLRRERLHQLGILNQLLRPLRLQLNDFHGSQFLLTSPTGKQEVIPNLDQLWIQVETMNGSAPDPLASDYLSRIQSS